MIQCVAFFSLLNARFQQPFDISSSSRKIFLESPISFNKISVIPLLQQQQNPYKYHQSQVKQDLELQRKFEVRLLRKANSNNSSRSGEAATGGVLYEKMCLEILQNSRENTCARVSFLIKLQTSSCNNLIINV